MNVIRTAYALVFAFVALVSAPVASADVVLTDDAGTVVVDMSACPVTGWNVYADQDGNAYVRYCSADQN